MATNKTAYWLDIANYDLDTAEAMCQTGRWLYVAFMCHQVIEKTLKAYWCETRVDDPPYTHNHKRLASGCGLYEQMDDEQRDFIATMDRRQTLSRDEALALVRRYKQVIRPRFDVEPKVMMFGSYSKGYANPDSDIDVAVIVPTYGDRKLDISKKLWHDVDQVSFLIEPVLMAEDRWSPLYDDVMRTGVAV